MTKTEFLLELEYSLEGKLPQDEVREILNDYNDIFENSTYDGKTEESTALELGSPAKIARKILEEEPIFAQVNNTITDTGNLASIPKRFGAFAIDTVICALIIAVLLIITNRPILNQEFSTWSIDNGGSGYIVKFYKDDNGITTQVEVLDKFQKSILKGSTADFEHFLDSNKLDISKDFSKRSHIITIKQPLPRNIRLLLVLVSLGIISLLNSFITWKFKGYTIGKKLFRIRVEKLDGSELSFIDALFRELIIKTIANMILGGLINLGSLIWAALTNEKNTVHDRASKTIVVSVKG